MDIETLNPFLILSFYWNYLRDIWVLESNIKKEVEGNLYSTLNDNDRLLRDYLITNLYGDSRLRTTQLIPLLYHEFSFHFCSMYGLYRKVKILRVLCLYKPRTKDYRRYYSSKFHINVSFIANIISFDGSPSHRSFNKVILFREYFLYLFIDVNTSLTLYVTPSSHTNLVVNQRKE